jgi:hypothetical protein
MLRLRTMATMSGSAGGGICGAHSFRVVGSGIVVCWTCALCEVHVYRENGFGFGLDACACGGDVCVGDGHRLNRPPSPNARLGVAERDVDGHHVS